LLAAAVLTTGCGSSAHHKNAAPTSPSSDDATLATSGAFSVRLLWLDGPNVSRNSTLRLSFFAPGGEPATTVADVSVRLWMTTMVHGGGDAQQKTHWVEGVASDVVVDNFSFTMGGPWDVHVKATVNGQADEAVIPVTVSGS
jgi:hypothetical protein